MTAQQQSLLAEYKLLEECILSGQIPERDLAEMTATDTRFGEWLHARASERRSKVQQPETQSEYSSRIASTAEDTDLITLAAWLHRRGKQAKAAADATVEEHRIAYLQEDAARFAQAGDIVKELADQHRRARGTALPHPKAANQA